jgi:hypothetical protein
VSVWGGVCVAQGKSPFLLDPLGKGRGVSAFNHYGNLLFPCPHPHPPPQGPCCHAAMLTHLEHSGALEEGHHEGRLDKQPPCAGCRPCWHGTHESSDTPMSQVTHTRNKAETGGPVLRASKNESSSPILPPLPPPTRRANLHAAHLPPAKQIGQGRATISIPSTPPLRPHPTSPTAPHPTHPTSPSASFSALPAAVPAATSALKRSSGSCSAWKAAGGAKGRRELRSWS